MASLTVYSESGLGLMLYQTHRLRIAWDALNSISCISTRCCARAMIMLVIMVFD